MRGIISPCCEKGQGIVQGSGFEARSAKGRAFSGPAESMHRGSVACACRLSIRFVLALSAKEFGCYLHCLINRELGLCVYVTRVEAGSRRPRRRRLVERRICIQKKS
jgi:hypothetical protein